MRLEQQPFPQDYYGTWAEGAQSVVMYFSLYPPSDEANATCGWNNAYWPDHGDFEKKSIQVHPRIFYESHIVKSTSYNWVAWVIVTG